MDFFNSLCEKVCEHCAKRKDIILLVVRLVLGVIFFQAGLGKLTNINTTALFFSKIGIPLPLINAWIVAVAEFAGGIMLIIGYKTRVISALLAFIMLIAILTAKLGGVGSIGDFIRLQELDYLLMFLILAAGGGGNISLDDKCGTDCCKK